MEDKLIEVKNLKKYFKVKNGQLHAVDDISFYINKGETLGMVGESGCGKSTTGRTVIRLIDASEGNIIFEGRDILKYNKKDLKSFRENVQIVFQDPYSCLNPRLPIASLISEPMEVMKKYSNKIEKDKRVKELMRVVGIEERLMNSYPHELDGGMRQRVGIARALSLNPKFIVLDEPVSALDVCIQAQILNLLKDLQKEFKLTFLFISHDLSVVKFISNRICVMYLGKIVELCDRNEIFKDPLHPYSKALLSAIPIPKPDVNINKIIIKGDVPSPVNPPTGCRFAKRCDYAKKSCLEKTPELVEVKPNRFVACNYWDKLKAN